LVILESAVLNIRVRPISYFSRIHFREIGLEGEGRRNWLRIGSSGGTW